jgi:hypothetical protein
MRPKNRDQLAGYSLSEFKTYLKKLGHKVPRTLANRGYVTEYQNRAYRWRWWSDEGFVVDVSVPLEEFDRWANSVEETYSFGEMKNDITN